MTALLLGQGSSLLPTPGLSYWLQTFPQGPRLEAPMGCGVTPRRPEKGSGMGGSKAQSEGWLNPVRLWF